MVIRQLIATQSLRLKKDAPDALREARILFAHASGRSLTDILIYGEQTVEPAVEKNFIELISRRSHGEPVAYLTGKKEFMGLEFDVNRSVLIPRPDTECLVEKVLERIKNGKVLELCTGSGCIGIALAHYAPNIEVTAVDISRDALTVAEKNAKKNHVAERITFQHLDILKEHTFPWIFDAVVSNPPYIRKEELRNLEKDVRDYEPMLALDGGSDGLIFYHRIKKIAMQCLRPGGLIAVEIGYDQGEQVKNIMSAVGEVEVYCDYAGNHRVVLATKNFF